MGKAVTPDRLETRGVISWAMLWVVRVRSSQGVARRKILPCDTVGLPMVENTLSNSGKDWPIFSIVWA